MSSRVTPLPMAQATASTAMAVAVLAIGQCRGVESLSGGNLQKIVIGRELSGDPRVVLANQPTRGLDVGSIEFVHKALSNARSEGSAVLLVSAELDEVLALSDRIAVMYDGKLLGPFDRSEVDRDRIGQLMAGGVEKTP